MTAVDAAATNQHPLLDVRYHAFALTGIQQYLHQASLILLGKTLLYSSMLLPQQLADHNLPNQRP